MEEKDLIEDELLDEEVGAEEQECTEEEALEALKEMLGGTKDSDEEPQEEMMPLIYMELDAYDEDQFQKGIKDASALAGYFTALKNAGMKADDIVGIYLQQITIDNNIKVAQLQAKTAVEVAKAQSMLMEKNSL